MSVETEDPSDELPDPEDIDVVEGGGDAMDGDPIGGGGTKPYVEPGYDYMGIEPGPPDLHALSVSCEYLNGRAKEFGTPPTVPYVGLKFPHNDHYNAILADCKYTFTDLSSAIKRLGDNQTILYEAFGTWTTNIFPFYQAQLETAAAWYKQAEEDSADDISGYFDSDFDWFDEDPQQDPLPNT